MNPIFSVIVPSFNRASLIEKAIKSVLKQDFFDWELVLIDDGSIDQTEKIITPYLSNFQIKYHYQSNSGVSSARNSGAAHAIGEWLVFLDSDDELRPDALGEFSTIIKSNPETEVITAGIFLVSANKRTVLLPENGKYIGHIPGSFAIKKSFFLDLGGYDSQLKFAENTELFFRIGILGRASTILRKPTVCYYDNQIGGSKNLKNSTDSILLILDKHKNSLPNPVKRLYHQIVGVNYLRFKEFSLARRHLMIAYKLDLKRLDTLMRFTISCLPPLAKKLYPENPRL